MHSWEKVEKTFLISFVIYSYFKDSAFTAVKRDAKFGTRCAKGEPFVDKSLTKGVPFFAEVGK